MALTLKFTVGAPCTGGNHFAITATPTPGTARTFQYTRAEMLEAITSDELETFARVLARLYRTQLAGNATPVQIKTAIEAKTLDLTVA